MITLKYYEWFQIYLILDNLENEKYNKSFLTLVEFWKQKLFNVFKVCVCVSETNTQGGDSDFNEFKKSKEDDKSRFDNLLLEIRNLDLDIEDILFTEYSLPSLKIHKDILPEIPEEMLEVLKPLLGGFGDS